MVRIIWETAALRSLKEIRLYINRDSREQARRVCRLIRDSTRYLKQYPEFGAVVPEFGCGEVRETGVYHYRIIYRIEEDGIHILLVVHGARQLTRDMIE